MPNNKFIPAISFSLVAIVMVSCGVTYLSQSEVIAGSKDLRFYLNNPNKDQAVSLFVECDGLFDDSRNNEVKLTAAFKEDSKTFPTEVTFGNVQLNEENEYSAFFKNAPDWVYGSSSTFSIPDLGINSEIYHPQFLVVKPELDGHTTRQLSEETRFKWIPDTNAKCEVVVRFYSGKYTVDGKVHSKSFQLKIPDIGLFGISAPMIKDFPKDVPVLVTFYRVRTEELTNSKGEAVGITIGSRSSGEMKIK